MALVVAAVSAALFVPGPAQAAATFDFAPKSGPIGSTIHVTGAGCAPGVRVAFGVAAGPGRFAETTADAAGAFVVDYVAPYPRAGEQTADHEYPTFVSCGPGTDVDGPNFRITGPTYTFSPASAGPGDRVQVSGVGCYGQSEGPEARFAIDGDQIATFRPSDDTNAFSFAFEVPQLADGAHDTSIRCLIQPLASPSGTGGQELTGTQPFAVGTHVLDRFLVADFDGLTLVNTDGSGRVALPTSPGDGRVSHAGTAVAQRTSSAGTVAQGFEILDLPSQQRRASVSSDGLYNPSWSPDDRSVAGIEYDTTNSNTAALVVRSATSADRRVLVGNGQQFAGKTAGVIVSGTDWHPATNDIVFTFAFNGPAGRESGVYAIKPDGSNFRTLVSGPFDAGQHTFARVSPRGTTVAYLRTRSTFGCTEHTMVRVVNIDGTNDRALADIGTCVTVTQPVWSPDGTTLGVSAVRGTAQTTVFYDATNGAVVPGPAGAADAIGSQSLLQWLGPAPATRPLPRTSGTDSRDEEVAPSRAVTDAAARAAHASGRSPLAVALRTPRNISTQLATILLNLLLATGVALLVFPAALFNSTYEEHYDEIRGWFGRKPRAAAAPRPAAARRWASFMAVVVATAALAALLDPKIKADRATALLVFGVGAATVVTTVLGRIANKAYLRETKGRIKSYPGGLAVGAATVAISRVVHFLPGYLYGIIGGFDSEPKPDKRRDGWAATLGEAFGLALGVGAWFAWQPVADRAAKPHASIVIAAADAILAAVASLSFQGLMFSMIPIKPLPGEKLWKWNRAVWSAFMGLGAFAFLHVLAHPAKKFTGSVTMMLVLFGAFGIVSVAFWAFFRFRKPKPSAPPAPTPTPPPPVAAQATPARPPRDRPLRAPGR